MNANIVYFYRVGDDFGFMSNFSRHPVTIDGRVWPTTEHYFQAQKFVGTSHEEEIRQAKSPSEAAKMGRERRRPLRPDWEKVKDDIMYKAVLAKFKQHKRLGHLLLATENATIAEHTVNDSYWGDGGDGSGKNKLGIILMKVRQELARGV